MRVPGRRVEEEEKRNGVEEEEEDVKLRNFFTDGIDLSLLKGYSVENQFFFFQPLFQKQPVGWCFRNLVKWVWWFWQND